jgi:uncharacterized protein YaaW (UPF0174 family)
LYVTLVAIIFFEYVWLYVTTNYRVVIYHVFLVVQLQKQKKLGLKSGSRNGAVEC